MPTRQTWLRRLTVCPVCACIPCGDDRPGVARSCVASADSAAACSSDAWTQVLAEVINLLRLYLTLPVTSCTAERSISGLRRLKTYLRSTVTQKRLNHLAALHCHREQSIDFEEICNLFIQRNEMRQATFAVFPK
jgi:hAT family C-terminal dimerisation region